MVRFATTTIWATMQMLFFLFFSFLLRSSLSLSLSLSLFFLVIEDFLTSGKRVNGLFLRLLPRQFLKCNVSFVRVFVSRAKDKTDERLIVFMCVCIYKLTPKRSLSLSLSLSIKGEKRHHFIFILDRINRRAKTGNPRGV
jgi:hypothetical protein